MTPEEYQSRREMIDRARALIEDYAYLQEMGREAERYC